MRSLTKCSTLVLVAFGVGAVGVPSVAVKAGL
jgi:hypothetical protein